MNDLENTLPCHEIARWRKVGREAAVKDFMYQREHSQKELGWDALGALLDALLPSTDALNIAINRYIWAAHTRKIVSLSHRSATMNPQQLLTEADVEFLRGMKILWE